MKKLLIALILVMMIIPSSTLIHAVSASHNPGSQTSLPMAAAQDPTSQKPAASMPVEVMIITGIMFVIFAPITFLPVFFDDRTSFTSVGLFPHQEQ